MDFSWTIEQEQLYTSTVEGVRARLQRDRAETYWTREDWRVCGSLGLLGLCVPTCYGGGGYSALMTAHILEAFGYSCEDMGLVFSAAAHLFACTMPLAEYGA